ncbi:MAG: hemolysin D [Pirellulales bacterium]
MATLADSLIASSSRPLAMRCRPDITSEKQVYLGKSYWVVKEPLGLNYFRFQEEEFSILKMLDGNTSLEEIKDTFEAQFAPQKISFRDLQQFIGTLHRSGLLITTSEEQGRQLKKRRDERKNKELIQTFSNILAIRFKGIDPDWMLGKMLPLVGWIFAWQTVMFVCFMALTALSLVVVQMDVFRSRLPEFQEFFGPSNWLFLGGTLAVTKVMHEFGHGLTCKRYGGECHEMGVMFLVLTPCLYCNVSDSWMLPNKWHRAAIGAAGMYVEITLATVATFVWWFSEPGLLNHICLQVMFVSSISTIIFNGNPLLRYDGYYILSDIMEVPNMRQKANDILRRFMAKTCLGLEQPDDPFLPQRNLFMFGMFTIASNIYRWFVMFSILYFLNKVFEPYGLQVIGQMIAIMGLYGLIVMPLWQLGKFMYVPGRMAQVKRKNIMATAGVAVAVALGVLFVPLPQRIKCPVEIRPRNAESVFVGAPGMLDELLVKPGDYVEEGVSLARVTNIDLLLEVEQFKGEEKRLTSLLHHLNNQRIVDKSHPEIAGQYVDTQQALESVTAQLKSKIQEMSKLNNPAPIPGIVFLTSEKEARPNPGGLTGWSGSIFDGKNIGAALSKGDVLCQIASVPEAGATVEMEAVLYINQDNMELVNLDQLVDIKLDAFPGKIFSGSLNEMGDTQVEFVPKSITAQAGGDLAAEMDQETGRVRPQNATFPGQVQLNDELGELKVGMRGRAKVYVKWQPAGPRIWKYLTHTFHFDL